MEKFISSISAETQSTELLLPIFKLGFHSIVTGTASDFALGDAGFRIKQRQKLFCSFRNGDLHFFQRYFIQSLVVFAAILHQTADPMVSSTERQ